MACHTHFNPDGKPAPPLPLNPEALISETIYNNFKRKLLAIRIKVAPIPFSIPIKGSATHPVMALKYDFLRLIPIATFHRTLQIRAMSPIQILEYTVLVLQPSINPRWRYRSGILDSRIFALLLCLGLLRLLLGRLFL